jgi:hypothetical protein
LSQQTKLVHFKNTLRELAYNEQSSLFAGPINYMYKLGKGQVNKPGKQD